MAQTLAALVVEIAANTAKFQQGMQQAVGTAQKTATQIQGSLAGIQSSFTGAIAMVTRFAGALGLTLGAAGLVAAGRAAMNFADEIDEMSERLGIGAERLQELRFAAGQSGVSAEKLELGIRNLSNTIADAARGEQAAVKTFRDMGVSIEGVAGTTAPLEVIMGRVADRIQSAISPTEKLGVASQAFGERVGSFLIPILGRGQKGIEDWAKAAREAGVVMSTEMIQQAAKAKDMIDAMSTAIMANLVPAIVAVSPLLISMAKGVSDLAAGMGRFIGSFAGNETASLEVLNGRINQLSTSLADLRDKRDALTANAAGMSPFAQATARDQIGVIDKEIAQITSQRAALQALADKRTAEQEARATGGATVRGMVIGTGRQPKELEAFRQQLVGLATTDETAQALLRVRQQVEKLTEAMPESAKDIAAIGTAMEGVIVAGAKFKDALEMDKLRDQQGAENIAADVERANQAIAEGHQVLADKIAETNKRIAEENALIGEGHAGWVAYAQAVQDARDEEQSVAANLPKTGLQQFKDDLADIETKAELFGKSFDATGAKASRLRDRMLELRRDGFKPWSEEIQAAKAELDSLNISAVFDDLGDAMGSIDARAKVLGNSFDTIAAEADALRAALVRLLGLPPTSETQAAIANLQAELDKVNQIAMIQAPFKDFFGALDQALTQSVAGVIQGTQTMEQAFKNMGQSIVLSMVQNVIRRGIDEVQKAIIALVAQLATTGLTAYFGGGSATGIGGVGSTVGGGATFSQFSGAAEGAFVKHSPGGSLMRVGEGGKDEAIFPLDRLPVVSGGGGNVTVNIHNNTDAKVSTRERQTPDGRAIEIMVDQMVTDGVASGRYHKVLNSTYGLQRKGRVG